MEEHTLHNNIAYEMNETAIAANWLATKINHLIVVNMHAFQQNETNSLRLEFEVKQ